MYPGRRDSGGELMAELTEYTALITSEHRDKPRFMAVVGPLVQPLVDQMNVLQSMRASSTSTTRSACSWTTSASGSACRGRSARR